MLTWFVEMREVAQFHEILPCYFKQFIHINSPKHFIFNKCCFFMSNAIFKMSCESQISELQAFHLPVINWWKKIVHPDGAN